MIGADIVSVTARPYGVPEGHVVVAVGKYADMYFIVYARARSFVPILGPVKESFFCLFDPRKTLSYVQYQIPCDELVINADGTGFCRVNNWKLNLPGTGKRNDMVEQFVLEGSSGNTFADLPNLALFARADQHGRSALYRKVNDEMVYVRGGPNGLYTIAGPDKPAADMAVVLISMLGLDWSIED